MRFISSMTLSLVLSSLVSITGCSGESSETGQKSVDFNQHAEETVAVKQRLVSFTDTHNTWTNPPSENTQISLLTSIDYLGFLALSAAESDLQELNDYFETDTSESVALGVFGLKSELTDSELITTRFDSALITQVQFPFYSSYIDNLLSYFGAELFELDFIDPTSRREDLATINQEFTADSLIEIHNVGNKTRLNLISRSEFELNFLDLEASYEAEELAYEDDFSSYPCSLTTTRVSGEFDVISNEAVTAVDLMSADDKWKLLIVKSDSGFGFNELMELNNSFETLATVQSTSLNLPQGNFKSGGGVSNTVNDAVSLEIGHLNKVSKEDLTFIDSTSVKNELNIDSEGMTFSVLSETLLQEHEHINPNNWGYALQAIVVDGGCEIEESPPLYYVLSYDNIILLYGYLDGRGENQYTSP